MANVSFDTNRNVPTQTIIDVMGRSRLGEALQAGTSGAMEGLNLNETIRKLRNRKKAAKFLADNPAAFGLEAGSVPPEYMEAAIENPSLLTALRKRSDEARTPFRIGANGRIEIADPTKPLTAVEAQAILRQRNMEIARSRAEKQYNYAAERLRLAQTAQERQAAQFLLTQASNIMLQASNESAFQGISGMVPEALETMGGVLPEPGQPAPAIGEKLPPAALARLNQAGEGVPVRFNNGQTWQIKNGVPVRIK